MPLGYTTLSISPSLSETPKNLQLTPEASMTGSYWVSNITSTSFQINISQKQKGNVSFFWYCQR